MCRNDLRAFALRNYSEGYKINKPLSGLLLYRRIIPKAERLCKTFQSLTRSQAARVTVKFSGTTSQPRALSFDIPAGFIPQLPNIHNLHNLLPSPFFLAVSVMQVQHLLFISCASTVILPTYLIITSFLCSIEIFILWSFVIYHICKFTYPLCNSGQICCSNHFCKSGYFSVSALVHSHSGLLQTFCNFGHICCFHPFYCPMRKLFIVTFAIEFNRGHISKKTTKQ